ncbi:uncharacterized protein C9orf57 homolog [Neovison vison]|uniref:uncharacterized protein C9orf57 homolog n=1 Tax=Neovison vison TaxID=452646 RepID=UPI001CF06DB7|nr:uncharacterized protein C9orf57 homolog [Neogale vison]
MSKELVSRHPIWDSKKMLCRRIYTNIQLSDVGGILCRLCNLSMPFHGCLLDFGTCRTKPGQYCMKQTHIRGGIQWYSISGCTETQDDCFKKSKISSGMRATYCCQRPLCNF